MNTQTFIGFREAVKKAFDLSFVNQNLGYYVKVILLVNVIFALVAGIFMVPLFFVQAKTSVDRANSFTSSFNTNQQLKIDELNAVENLSDGTFTPDDFTQPTQNTTFDTAYSSNYESSTPFVLIATLVGMVVAFVVAMMQYNVSIMTALNIYNSNLAGIKGMLKTALFRSLSMFFLLVVYGLVILIGLLLFIIPGIVFAVRFGFAPYVMLDENKGALASMKESWRLVKGNTLNVYLKLIGFTITIWFLALLLSPVLALGMYTGISALLLFIGQLVFMLFSVVLYKDLKRIKTAPEPFATPQVTPETVATL
ncbi:hypothetical protein A2619_02620 [candidate division WWE3 bacterium RIFOXYD1_FULL_39_9]|uniref:Glycerophosphoryl diester phosphodiesterase membrane domain-containing protein n=1 Tax=candidate division WWE3 bacterium RIFOXYD1_FULL_39_9 TaxID=1802649 RepID=A0A1F4XAX1_UNCKA|nr:MAG: hypothetical protein A2619_02620 [candidate division WWE3 bacterium RIFOXYD1_FULL_39_9]